MKKNILAVMMAALVFSTLTPAVMTTHAKSDMTITHPAPGITEGGCEENANPDIAAKETFVDYVGIGSEDIGPWEHGVIFSGSSGTVYSNYTNKKYWHGSSARGSSDFYRSPLVAPNQTSKASVKTYLPNGNHAYWRVDETQN